MLRAAFETSQTSCGTTVHLHLHRQAYGVVRRNRRWVCAGNRRHFNLEAIV